MLFDKDDDTSMRFCEDLSKQLFVSYSWHMRWDSLFDDLEAQLAEQSRAQLRDEIAENTRIERATAQLSDVLSQYRGSELGVMVIGHTEIRARLGPCSTDYFCLETEASQWIIRYQVVESIALPSERRVAPLTSQSGKAIRFSAVLRGMLRDRSRCQIYGTHGSLIAEGTLSQVAKDFLLISMHQRDEYVRASNPAAQVMIPLESIGWVVSTTLN